MKHITPAYPLPYSHRPCNPSVGVRLIFATCGTAYFSPPYGHVGYQWPDYTERDAVS